jgi:ribosomal protein L20A (L18A)
MRFKVKGYIMLPKVGKRVFSKSVEAKSENHAKDVVMALFGSHNGLKRTKIVIESVEGDSE